MILGQSLNFSVLFPYLKMEIVISISYDCPKNRMNKYIHKILKIVSGTLISAVFVNYLYRNYYQIMLSKAYTHSNYSFINCRQMYLMKEKKNREALPVNLPDLIINTNIYYLLCTRLRIWCIRDITRFP